ncbi:MAG: hypothetical protein K2X90_02870 [Candidatus Babeliaceae bacterium]|nr:hypothetical protein [Candidatus Babeliaceae bacterium]
MFVCRHNDSNTDIYLRRIDAKLEKILEQIDKTPDHIKTYNEIEKSSAGHRLLASCMLEALQILRRGKLTTGIFADMIPYFLNQDNQAFDHYVDVVDRWRIEEYNYTEEEAAIFRNSLPSRTNHLSIIKDTILDKIEYSLHEVIKYEVMQRVCAGSVRNMPENYGVIYEKIRDEDFLKEKAIIKSIADGDMKNMRELRNRIIKDFC